MVGFWTRNFNHMNKIEAQSGISHNQTADLKLLYGAEAVLEPIL